MLMNSRVMINDSGRDLSFNALVFGWACLLVLLIAVQATAQTTRLPAASVVATADARDDATARVWTDSTGLYKLEAKFVGVTDTGVQLQKVDQAATPLRIVVPLEKLSEADRKFVAEVSQAASSETDGIKPQAGAWLSDLSGSIRDGMKWAEVAPSRMRRLTAKLDTSSLLPEGPLPADMVYIQLSKSLAQQAFDRPVSRHSMVRNTIVGNPVTGHALTTGQTRVQFVTSRNQAVMDLFFTGQVHSNTTANGGRVQVHSNSRTEFSALKRLILDSEGLRALPTNTSAQTTIATSGLSTELPRLRGRIARRIASNQVAQTRGQAQAQSSRNAETRISREFDLAVHQNLDQSGSALAKFLRRIPQEELVGVTPHFSSSGSYLQVAFVRGSNGGLAATLPPAPAALGTPDVAVHVHSSVVQRVMTDPVLRKAVEPFVQGFMTDRMRGLVGDVGYASSEPVELQQSQDGAWWSVVVRNAKVPR